MNIIAPDLSNLRSHGPGHFLNVVVRGVRPQQNQLFALTVNFVRLSDLALDLYKLACKAFAEFFGSEDTFPISAAFLATGHLEGCVDTVRRATLFLERIRKDPRFSIAVRRLLIGRVTHKPLPLMPGPKRQIRDMRHAIQHLEEKILKRTIGDNEAFVLSLTLMAVGLSCSM